MTDHSTARALVEKLRQAGNGFFPFSERGDYGICNEAADFIEQTLTPPEVDTLSGEDLAWFNEVRTGKHPDVTLHSGMAAVRLERIAAALQSRVSPQEELREALEQARPIVAGKERIERMQRSVNETNSSELTDLLAKIYAALTASRVGDGA